ncbi:uncharacterized protein LOC111705979 [Eurytemora carolleeae]|uniref:uncharacterized protein LOC111705979 n=1 Tax=Eurytemora carolleeae TaxID=1294199 RepID=UPI000C77D88C|nr:uncharacterized protein LOC111705979 [Eurytemora carolleeae]|eukprot:XP_023334474.1 uncharacterized protein LOC111705979 [Eurytemora affinis]
MNREKQEDPIHSSSSPDKTESRVGITSDRRYLEPAGVNRRRERNDSSGRDNRSSRDDRRRREDTRTERRKGNKDLNVERKYKGRNESIAERDRDREDDTRKNWSETGGARRENTLRDGQGEVRILYSGSRGAPFSGQMNLFELRSSQQQTASVGIRNSSFKKSIENDQLIRYEREKQDDYRKGVQNKGRVIESELFSKKNSSNSFKLQPGELKRKSQTPENTNWQDTINSVFNQSNSTGFGVSQPALVIPSLPSEKQHQSLFKTCEISKLTDKHKRPVLLANPDPVPNLTGFSKPLQISSVQGTSKLSMLDNNQSKKIKLDSSWTRPGLLFTDTTPSSSTPALISNVLRKSLDLEPTGSQNSDERVEVLKTQIGELKSYILKLEEEKQKAEENSTSASTCTCAKDGQLLALIKENIEKVRIGQEKEKEKLEHERGRLEMEKSSLISEQKRLHEEKERLEKARVNLKQTLEQGMKLLEGEKGKMEREIRIRLELEGKKELDGLRMKLAEVEEERIKEKDREKEEEKRHVEEELKELEIRKEMTTKAIESEARIEDLETTVGHSDSLINELKTKLQAYKSDVLKLRLQAEQERREKETLKKEYDGDYRAFLDKKSGLEEGVRIRCVFCPGENMVSLVGFIFHVAREHMFDQYKKVELETEAQQVGLLLRRLEDKVKSSTSSQEVNSLHSRIHQLEKQVTILTWN